MSLLEALSTGLRGAAGVLSPDIAKQNAQSDQQNSQLRQQQQMEMLKHIQSQVQAGAMEPEAGSRLLEGMGAPLEIAQRIVGGPGLEAQKRIAEMAREKSFRSALTGLGPDATQEQLAQVAGQFAGPDKLLDVQQKSIDRRETLEEKSRTAREQIMQRAQEFQERIEQRKSEHEARITQAQESRASREQIAQMQIDARRDLQTMVMDGRRSMAALAGSLRQPASRYSDIKEGANGGFIGFNRATGVMENVPTAEGVAPAPKATDRRADDITKQRDAAGQQAELLNARLEKILTENPRSATGIFSPIVRGTEATVNSINPGTIGSQATISRQTKEQLIGVLGQIKGGGAGRLSNQDQRRVDTAIGAISSGTPESMSQGIKDTYDLIDSLRGRSPRSMSAPGIRADDKALIDKYLKK